jgi:mono/diheme cytochrome c family protein
VELGGPSLQHLPDWYVDLTLKKFRDGLRGGAAGDSLGQVMAVNVVDMSDEQIADLAAYVQTLGDDGIPFAGGPIIVQAPPLDIIESLLPEGVTVEMVEAGSDIFNGGAGVCFSCHLPGGVGGPNAPVLTDSEWLNIDGSYLEIIDVIKTGVSAPVQYPSPMLALAGMGLSDDQVAAVAAYVFMLSQAGG